MKSREKRKPTFIEAIIPIIAMLIIVGVGYGYLKYQTEVLLLLAAAVAALIAFRVGVKWDEMLEEMSLKIAKSMPAVLILITVGLIIGTWMLSGTIPMMIYYGIQIINPKFLLITAFLITALVSTATGTSWGSVGTMGVALMGIAQGLGVNLAATAGSVVAGSYFGDKLSPLSDTTNLAPLAAGSELYEHIKHMLYTTVPAAIISLIVYGIVGMNTSGGNVANPEMVDIMLSTLDTMYNWNILLLLPVVIIIIGSVFKKPTIPVMALSGVVAGIIAVTVQGFTVSDVFTAAVSGFSVDMVKVEGFNSSEVIWEVTRLVNRGGMSSMMGTTLLLFCAFVYAGIISRAGCLDVMLEHLMKSVKTTGGLVLSTVISCIIMAFATGVSYLTILMPGELFKDAYRMRGLAAKNLSRTLEDSGTVVVPLVPWSSAGAYMAGTLGVATLEYLPWAIMCYAGFMIAIFYGYTGIGIAKLDNGA